jgi:lyso-ornithine lipid O-acyltransferase
MIVNLLRILVKGPLVVLTLILFFILGLLNKILFIWSTNLRKSLAQRNTQWTSWVCAKLIGYFGTYNIGPVPKGSLIICNHMSYMDVLVIASKIPTLFVTSVEMKNTPFLGWITQIGECLYVNRKSHKNLNHEIETIQNWIKNGFNVLIFPEATTSNGVDLKNFKSSLLQVAHNTDIQITTYCLKYIKLNNKSVTKENLIHNITWFEAASFLPHALKQLTNKSVTFELTEIERFLFTSTSKITKSLQI